jgi:3-isopropylmalate dehydrogenase
MLRHSFGLHAEADAIDAAVRKTIADGFRTADIAFGAPAVGTREMAAAILARL